MKFLHLISVRALFFLPFIPITRAEVNFSGIEFANIERKLPETEKKILFLILAKLLNKLHTSPLGPVIVAKIEQFITVYSEDRILYYLKMEFSPKLKQEQTEAQYKQTHKLILSNISSYVEPDYSYNISDEESGFLSNSLANQIVEYLDQVYPRVSQYFTHKTVNSILRPFFQVASSDGEAGYELFDPQTQIVELSQPVKEEGNQKS